MYADWVIFDKPPDCTPLHLTRGLGVGVAGMSVGEKAVLELKPSFGFGDEGDAELGIPGNATLIYEVSSRCARRDYIILLVSTACTLTLFCTWNWQVEFVSLPVDRRQRG